MQPRALFVALIPFLALACAQTPVETKDQQATMLMLPVGQPDDGREAFVALGCGSCHTVAWDPDLAPPIAATPGPELGLDVARPGPGGLATSIVAPSHKVPEKYRRPGLGGASPMVDYTGTMTIRQLADIVAYLERQGLETQARTGQGAPG